MSHGLAGLADHPQGAVPVGDREVIKIGAAGFRDTQGVESEQARQNVVVAAGQSGLDENAPSSLRSSPIRVDS
ncbi:MAG TPA: hypothetical protein VHF25_05000 [Nitriliruptorales bacterium]|nr:hypothetical protein [Nitriliruptorales bacterium]